MCHCCDTVQCPSDCCGMGACVDGTCVCDQSLLLYGLPLELQPMPVLDTHNCSS